MQTFLPYEHFRESLAVLDNIRLNKQIVEAWQIYTGRVPQANHPACLMWADHRPALGRYLFTACVEYVHRFGKDHSILEKFLDLPAPACGQYEFKAPPLMRLSHCVNLMRKGVAVEQMRKAIERICIRNGIFLPPHPPLFPEGYFWPVQPVGKKARGDTENWKAFWERHRTA